MLGQHRSTQRKAPKGRADDAALTADIVALATEYGRYGYRRITAMPRAAGWAVNVKRVDRIWRPEGLAEARILIEGWRQHYNTRRPHSSLGYNPPAPPAVLWPGAPRPSTMAAKPTMLSIRPAPNGGRPEALDAVLTDGPLVLAHSTIHIPSVQMEMALTGNVRQLRDRGGESEKITINLGHVDLGRIDLLVQEGFYSNRTDFIRAAIRSQLGSHSGELQRSIERHTLELGLRDYTVADLQAALSAGETLHIRVVGLARIAPEVTPELARATIASITVLGGLQASAEVKRALADRIN